MSSSRTLSRKLRTSFTCIKPRFDPSIILLYIAVSVEQYCDTTRLNALPENEGILEVDDSKLARMVVKSILAKTRVDWQTVEAANAQEALDLLAVKAVDIALIDFN